MSSMRDYIKIVEDVSFLHAFQQVSTPRGRGRVIKVAGDRVYVEMDEDGEIKEFTDTEVRSSGPNYRGAESPTKRPPSRASFSMAQLAAGRNTPILKE